MASLLRLRIQSLLKTNRFFSTIPPPKPTTPLSTKEKARAALTLIKSENDPEKIVQICNSASLSPEFHLDRLVFSVAISKLSQSNKFSHIQKFLDGHLRSSERFAAHAIILYGKAGMVDDAIRSFKEYHADVVGTDSSGSVKALNALIFAFILAKKFEDLNRVYIEFPKTYNIVPNLETFNNVVKAYCESGSSSSSYSVLAEMDRRGVKPNAVTFGNMISGFYIEEKYDDVGKVLDLKKKYGISQEIETYNIRILSLCKLKRSAEAKLLLSSMLSRNVKPNADTFSHLILGFCVEGDLEEAKSVLNSMVNWGFQPDAKCYFPLVHGLCEGGDFESALKLCMVCLGKGWVPNCTTMKSLVDGLARVGKVREAKKLVGEMKKRFSKNIRQWEELESALFFRELRNFNHSSV